MNNDLEYARYLTTLASAAQEGNLNVLEDGIRFLEADPASFRTGYAKEHVWKYLVRRYTLDSATVERLYAVALQNLEKPLRREFWMMCNSIARLANEDFWQRVYEKTLSRDEDIAKRASYPYAYAQGLDAGERVHQRVSLEWLRLKYRRHFKQP